MKYYEFKTVETYNETYMADEEKAELINNAIKILKSDNIYFRGFKTLGIKEINTKDKIKAMYCYQDGFMETYYVLKIELSSKNYLILQEKEHPQLFKLFNKRFNELWEQEKQEQQQQKEITREDIENIAFREQLEAHIFSEEHIEVIKQKIGKIDNGEALKEMIEKNKQEQQEQAEQTQNDYYLRKHDKGKAKLLQVPVEAITAISEIMDYGSSKYGENTWQGVEIERYMQAASRHIYAIQSKDKNGKIFLDLSKKDNESNIEHIKHALCNLAYAVALYEMKKADNEK